MPACHKAIDSLILITALLHHPHEIKCQREEEKHQGSHEELQPHKNVYEEANLDDGRYLMHEVVNLW